MNNFIKLLAAFILLLPFYLHHFGYIQIPAYLSLGFINLSPYGLIAATAIIFVCLLSYNLIKKEGLNNFDAVNLSLVTVFVGIAGARVYHVITNLSQFSQDPIQAFFLWQGGLGIIGGVFAGALALFIYLKRINQNPWPIIAAIAIYVPIGQAIGRLGNLVNYELFGFSTNVPWAMYVPIENNPYLNLSASTLFHPLYAYEAAMSLILFVILYYSYKRFGLSKVLILFYALGYSVIRFLMDFGKPFEPAPTPAQLIAIIVWIVGITAIITNKLKHQND